MKKLWYTSLLSLLVFTAPAFSQVSVGSPSNGGSYGSSVPFYATATTSTCQWGVASMGVYVDNNLMYVVNSTTLSTNINLGPGTHWAVLEEWDYCGGATSTGRSITVNQQAGVSVASPSNGATIGSPAAFVASATTACPNGVSAMGVYSDNNLMYVVQGNQLNTQINLPGGNHYVVIEEWDGCGGAAVSQMNVNVNGGQVISAIQNTSNWGQWGELGPDYNVCNPCNGVSFSMAQHQGGLSGNATQFNIGGWAPYADALFYNAIMGDGSPTMPDQGHTLVPTLHNFTYDLYFYVTNLPVTQSLEFDINQYPGGGVGLQFGTQCDHLGSGDWDIWNNVNATWVPTGAPCNMVNNGWNHLTFQVQRQSNNDLLYQTITLNGQTFNINTTEAPFQVPGDWYGMTVNFQMDGNYNQAPNTVYIDDFNVTYS